MPYLRQMTAFYSRLTFDFSHVHRLLARAPAAGEIAWYRRCPGLSIEKPVQSRRACLPPGCSSFDACSRPGSPLFNARGGQKIVMTMIA